MTVKGKLMSRDVIVSRGYKRQLPANHPFRQPLSESALQIAVVEHLRLTGVPGLLYFSIPNEGKRTPANGARMKAMGMLPGVADLFVMRRGAHPLFLELKKAGKNLREEQKAFGTLAFESGCNYRWADNLDDALRMLRDYGAIRSK